MRFLTIFCQIRSLNYGAMMALTAFSYKYDWFSREEMINQSVNEIIEEDVEEYSDLYSQFNEI